MSLLDACLAYWERRPFRLGGADCLHFALEASAAAGGRELSHLIPPYESPMAVLALMRAGRWRTLADVIDAHAQSLPPALAAPGDIAWWDDGGIGALGVVLHGEALFLAPDGFARRPLLDCRTWRA